VHPNTVRFHLGVLADAGVVTSISGALEELGSDVALAELDAFPEPDLCVARLRKSGGPRNGSPPERPRSSL
jgi:hypothetical protein